MKQFIKNLIIGGMFVFLCLVPLNVLSRENSNYQYAVFLDPGHGGYDGGADGNGLVEKDVNLTIGLALRSYLESVGIKVYMTRDEDTDLVEPGRGTKKKRDLDERIKMINLSDADLYLSIHANSLPNPRWQGAQTFYDDSYMENKLLASYIQQNCTELLHNTDRLPKKVRNLYLFKMTNRPGALVEVGFLSNPEEANLLKQESYQEQVAFAIYLGIIEYFKEKYNFPVKKDA